MSGRWFRFYDEVLNDPKVQQLPPALFKAWVNLLCIASKNDGRIPVEDIAFGLRMSPDDAAATMIAVTQAGLAIAYDGYYEPHNWRKRQYKSDVTDPTAADRQQRYRNKKRNATVTVTLTRTDTESDTEKKDIRAVAPATRPSDGQFEEFWKAYPKRRGANPSHTARKHWDAAIKSGCDPGTIIKAIKSGIGFDPAKIGTEYIPRASTWLSERRFKDYREAVVTADLPGFYAAFNSEQLAAWENYGRATGKKYPRDKAGGWRFPTEWPPESEAA